MKLNLFQVPQKNVQALKEKFESVELTPISSHIQSSWTATFYFSKDEEQRTIPWVETFREFFHEPFPRNLIQFAAYLFESPNRNYVATFGKAHFYVRQFCNHDFGIEMAKRIANEGDTRMTSSKKFAGRRKKDIKSFASNTSLDVESGESVDFIKAAITKDASGIFGRVAKFGSSLLLNPPIEKDEIGTLLDHIEQFMTRDPLFTLPRTVVVSDDGEIAKYDRELLTAISTGAESAGFAHAGHEMVGVDFVFSGNESYSLSCKGHSGHDLGDQDLDLSALVAYIDAQSIHENDIFDIKIRVAAEGQKPYSRTLKDALDFIIDGENVMLSNGRWLRFNEDYLEQLNRYVDGIDVEPTENEFRTIALTEPAFNASNVLQQHGYIVVDKDFSIVGTAPGTPTEAWDQKKGSTVYAVKFGTPQKVGYVCDQAMSVLEILRNNANVATHHKDWDSYCLWLFFTNKNPYLQISQCGSIILKQKIEAWARRCRELSIQPKLKMSRSTPTP